jgi:hypothetical protein
MIRLQNNEVIFNNSEKLGAVENLNFTGGGFFITLADGSIVFIPEEDCTEGEKEVFEAYHEFYKSTSGIKPEPEISPEQAKADKINELDAACNAEILGGFYSSVKNGKRLYGFSYEDQINMEALKNNVSLGFLKEGTLEYYAKGGQCETWRNSDFIQLYNEAMLFKTGRIKLCKELKEQAEEAKNMAALEQIKWIQATQHI